MNWYKKAKLVDKSAPNAEGVSMLQLKGRNASFTLCQDCGKVATHPTLNYTDNKAEWVWKEDNELDPEEMKTAQWVASQIGKDPGMHIDDTELCPECEVKRAQPQGPLTDPAMIIQDYPTKPQTPQATL